MTENQDGGRWALAGYLYQIVSMLSITAHVSNLANESDTSDIDDINVLIDLDLTTSDPALVTAQHEKFGEDALFQAGDKSVLVQFKYTATSTPRKIRRGELANIIDKWDQHVQWAKAQGKDVTACALVTNRELTSRGRAAQQLWEEQRKRKRSYVIRRSPGYSLQHGIEGLKEFARTYGAIGAEVETGVDRLVGQVLTQTGYGPPDASVSQRDLVKAFTGSYNARPLAIRSAAELSGRHLAHFGEYIGVAQWNESPVPRVILDEVIRETRRHALVGLYGPGGCGKSVIVWQLMRQLQSERRCFFVVDFARDVQVSWITDKVHEWRNLPVGTRPDDDIDTAIARLLLATAEQYKPILWLALDGLDEGIQRLPEQRNHVQRIVTRFWRMDADAYSTSVPLATLVVTCRRENDLRDLLNIPVHYLNSVKTIRVDDFSSSEFGKALQTVFGLDRGDTYEDYNKYLGSLGGHDSQPTPLNISSLMGSANERVVRALHHPAMWRALLSLETDVRLQAIRGDLEAVRQLAGNFITWFCEKLRVRTLPFHISEYESITVLRAIADHTSSGPPPFAKADDWIRPARGTGLVTDFSAEELYREAEVAGLIGLDASHQWRWRHELVLDYLMQPANGMS